MRPISFNIFRSKQTPKREELKKPPTKKGGSVVSPPASRVSYPNYAGSFTGLKESLGFIKPGFAYEYIPVIRKLLSVNSSVSLATSSIAQLANTGYRVKFDSSVTSEQAIAMRDHLDTVTKTWGQGLPGVHGLVNKLIYQAFIGGAMSTEWSLKNDLSGVAYLAFINPEQVRVTFDYQNNQYKYWQVLSQGLFTSLAAPDPNMGAIPLNPYTYQYYGLVGDTESPIGIPPFLSSLDDLQAQLKMLRNIGFVSDQLGILGFLEVLMAKPEPHEGETHIAYQKRLEDLLNTAKKNVQEGVKDGIVAGYMDDHEFDFHSNTKDTSGVASIFDINQRMVSNGLFSNPQFLGGAVGGTETMITVIFTKMLSQLTDIQTYVRSIIERGFFLELTLAGFKFKKVEMEFNTSTFTDEVKLQQAKEIKQRVARILYADGIVDQDQYAWLMGYDKADQKEPRVPIDPNKIMADQKAKQDKEKGDQANDRKSRAKKKDQPKGKDTK